MTLQAQIAPDSLDNVDWDEVTRGAMGDTPTDWARDPKQVSEMREQRQQAQAEQQQKMEQAQVLEVGLKARPENINKLEQAMEGA